MPHQPTQGPQLPLMTPTREYHAIQTSPTKQENPCDKNHGPYLASLSPIPVEPTKTPQISSPASKKKLKNPIRKTPKKLVFSQRRCFPPATAMFFPSEERRPDNLLSVFRDVFPAVPRDVFPATMHANAHRNACCNAHRNAHRNVCCNARWPSTSGHCVGSGLRAHRGSLYPTWRSKGRPSSTCVSQHRGAMPGTTFAL